MPVVSTRTVLGTGIVCAAGPRRACRRTGVRVEAKRKVYDVRKFAILPMGFCYPGKGKGGDLPSRPECAPPW